MRSTPGPGWGEAQPLGGGSNYPCPGWCTARQSEEEFGTAAASDPCRGPLLSCTGLIDHCRCFCRGLIGSCRVEEWG